MLSYPRHDILINMNTAALKPRISVIVPCYNIARYVGSCLNSLAAQTHDSFEVICIDDESTDETGRILDEFAAADARFKVIHQKRRGPSGARKAGIAASTAPLIAFADGDDFVSSRYLEVLEALMTRYGVDIACCGFVSAPAGVRVTLNDDANTVAHALNHCQVMGPIETLREIALGTIDFPFWGKIMKRELTAFCSCPDNMVYEDIWNLGPVTAHAQRIVYYPTTLYCYLSRRESATRAHSDSLDTFWQFRKAIETFEATYKECLGLEHATDDGPYCLHLVHRLCAQYVVLQKSEATKQERAALESALRDEIDAAYQLALSHGISATHPQMIRAAILLRSPKAHYLVLSAYRLFKAW